MRELSTLYCPLACATGGGKESAAHSADCPFSPFSLTLAPRGEEMCVGIWEWSPVEREGEQESVQFCLLLTLPSRPPRVLSLCKFSLAMVTKL